MKTKRLTITLMILMQLQLLLACGKREDAVNYKAGNGSETFVPDLEAARAGQVGGNDADPKPNKKHSAAEPESSN